MGTKVQFKSYPPMYNPIKKQNEHSSSSLSWCYEDSLLNGHLYGVSFLGQANGHPMCDKEMLKCTMIQHEDTFRKQVYELHRLYGIQKEMMHELKKRDLQSKLFASQKPTETAEKLFQIPHFCTVSRLAAMDLGNVKHPLNIDSGYCHMPIRTEVTYVEEGGFLDHKHTSQTRKKLDLHLPAEVYIDCENDALVEKENKPSTMVANPSKITCKADIDSDLKLVLCKSKADGCINGCSQFGLHPVNGQSRLGMADLNEPVKSSSYDEENVSTSSQIIGSKSEQEEIQGKQWPSNGSLLSRELFMANHGHKQIFSNAIDIHKKELFPGWSSCTDAFGELRRKISNGESSGTSELVKDKKKNYEFVFLGQSETDKWKGEMPCPDTENSTGTSALPNLNSSVVSASQVLNRFQGVPQSDNFSTTSLSISTSSKTYGMQNIPIAVQDLTNFNLPAVIKSRKADATFQSPCTLSDNLLYVDVNSRQRLEGEFSSWNGFHQDRKCSEGPLYADVKQSLEPTWLRTKGVQHDSTVMEESDSQHMKLMSDSNAVASAANKLQNKEKGSTSLLSLVESSSSLKVKEKNEESFRLKSSGILGFPISEGTEKRVEDDLSSVDFGNHINLNFSASCMVALSSPVILLVDEVLSPLSAANFTKKVASMIDLEGQLATKADKNITAEEESKELNCNIASVKSTSSKEDDLQQTDGSHEALIREAAESLLAVSLVDGKHSHNLTCPSIPASFDTLHWFADFVSCSEARTRISIKSSDGGDDHDDGLDIFEYMTLKLKEIKEDELVCKLQENLSRESTITGMPLLTRPRRGQAMKRRQRRDFQKDILPRLASLSRHEVAEDLQAFGGLMRASGKSSSSRNTSRKGPNCQARGRRRPRSLSITVSEIHIGSSPEKKALTKQEITTAGILGWGRTIRRRTRQRLLPANASVPLV